MENWQSEIRKKVKGMSVLDVRKTFGNAVAEVFEDEIHGARRRYCDSGVLKMVADEGAAQYKRAYLMQRRIAACKNG
jgi:hypothetical protein